MFTGIETNNKCLNMLIEQNLIDYPRMTCGK